MLRITMFGTVWVCSDLGELGPKDFGGVKPKKLFELLALGRGHAISKDVLAEELWPRSLPRNVSATLESYVSVLRRRLWPNRDGARRLLQTSPGAYQLDAALLDVDLDRFDELLERAEASPRRERIELRRRALGLATGEVLEDEPYAPWAQRERDLYRSRVVRAHSLVADDLVAEGDYLLAIRHAETAIQLAPCAEEAARPLMLAYHGLGHDDSARRAYAACCRRLAEDLDVDPTTETVDLAAAIDAGTPIEELVTKASRPVVGSVASSEVFHLVVQLRVALGPDGTPRIEAVNPTGPQQGLAPISAALVEETGLPI